MFENDQDADGETEEEQTLNQDAENTKELELRNRLKAAADEMGVSVDMDNWDYDSKFNSLSNPCFSKSTTHAPEHDLVPDRDPFYYDGRGTKEYKIGGNDGGMLRVRGVGELIFSSYY